MLVVTILTGHRPELLARTLDSSLPLLAAFDPTVIALHNGYGSGSDGDRATADILTRWVDDDYIDRVVLAPGMVPIGRGVSQLAHMAAQSGADHWLHLEDDWQANPAVDDDWYAAAVDLLDSGKVGQVRLRNASDPVLSYDMVTKRRIVWQDHGGWRIGEAHLTFNPALVRVADIPHGFPCVSEADAQRKWRRHHRRVAQHLPGIWTHIGDGQSLRKQYGQ